MSAEPLTILSVGEAEENAIRAAVCRANVTLLGSGNRIASARDVPGLIALLSDPLVSDPIYDLPRPFTASVIGAWVKQAHVRQRKRRGGARCNERRWRRYFRLFLFYGLA